LSPTLLREGCFDGRNRWKNRRARATDDSLMMTCSSPAKFVGNFCDGVNPSLPSYVHVQTEFAFIAYLLEFNK
jgi:hypothetical protein